MGNQNTDKIGERDEGRKWVGEEGTYFSKLNEDAMRS